MLMVNLLKILIRIGLILDSSLPNKKIEILIAPPTSGTRDAWNSLVMVKGCTKTAKSLHETTGKNS